MFLRVKKVGPYQYFQIAENRREGKRVKQSIIATLGRLDKLTASGAFDQLLRSARFAERIMVLSEHSRDVHDRPDANVVSIGPALIFERLWRETGCQEVVRKLLTTRHHRFDVERAVPRDRGPVRCRPCRRSDRPVLRIRSAPYPRIGETTYRSGLPEGYRYGNRSVRYWAEGRHFGVIVMNVGACKQGSSQRSMALSGLQSTSIRGGSGRQPRSSRADGRFVSGRRVSGRCGLGAI